MGSADTVFIKHKLSAKNHDSDNEAESSAPNTRATSNCNAIITGVDWKVLNDGDRSCEFPEEAINHFKMEERENPPVLLTTNKMCLSDLHKKDREIQADILKTVHDNEGLGSSVFSAIKSKLFQPVITTLSSWEKTLGTKLPPAEE